MDSKKTKYIFVKLLNSTLAIVLALSLLLLTFSSSAIGVFFNSKIIKKEIQSYQQNIVEQFNDYLMQYENKIDIPIDVVVNSINNDNMNVIIDTVSENFTYNYTTVFSDDEQLYKSLKTSITEYCDENNISASDKIVSETACLVVDAVNEFFGGNSTAKVNVFKFIKSNKMIAIMVVSVLAFLASIVVLNLINYGKHRKYNQIGLGMVTAGYLIVVLPIVSKLLGYVDSFVYSDNPIYAPAIKECWCTVIEISMMIGMLFLLIGAAMLLWNFIYFNKKKKRFELSKEDNIQSRTEYMEAITAKKTITKSLPKEEKIVYQVDFDDENIE